MMGLIGAFVAPAEDAAANRTRAASTGFLKGGHSCRLCQADDGTSDSPIWVKRRASHLLRLNLKGVFCVPTFWRKFESLGGSLDRIQAVADKSRTDEEMQKLSRRPAERKI